MPCVTQLTRCWCLNYARGYTLQDATVIDRRQLMAMLGLMGALSTAQSVQAADANYEVRRMQPTYGMALLACSCKFACSICYADNKKNNSSMEVSWCRALSIRLGGFTVCSACQLLVMLCCLAQLQTGSLSTGTCDQVSVELHHHHHSIPAP